MRAKHKRHYQTTTDGKHALPVVPNLLDRQFETSAADQVWKGDITYLRHVKAGGIWQW